MIHNTFFFNLVEDYCMDRLPLELEAKFKEELLINEELKKEVDLLITIQNAVSETDVLTLRNKINNIMKQSNTQKNKKNGFSIFEKFTDFTELNQVLSSEELINFYDSLPKVHAYHHENSLRENIHQFYRDQFETDDEIEALNDADIEFDDMDGLEKALLERDILSLRQTLKHVANSVEPQFNTENIDNYLNRELRGEELLDFEKEAAHNRSLREEILLHEEIENAIREDDVIDLRSKMDAIVQSETSWNVKEESIEDFVDGILEGEALEKFLAEYNENPDLRAEVKLRQQVNYALSENDIFDLREKLKSTGKESTANVIKMFIPESKSVFFRYVRNSVAVIILLVGLAGLIGRNMVSTDQVYESFYQVPSWSLERSPADNISIIQKANLAYVNGNYHDVISMLDASGITENSGKNAVIEFYKAASFQKLDRFSEAVAGYSKVIEQGDNLFIEEAEWYISLCYIQLGEMKKASNHLLAVIERNGYYVDDAHAVIRKLKKSKKMN